VVLLILSVDTSQNLAKIWQLSTVVEKRKE
jgi:hypothetical protein